MTEAKFTRGPWHYHAKLSGSENHRGFRIYGPGASGWALAEVQPVDEDGIEGEANARLIAASPDLLDCLRDLIADRDEKGLPDYPAITRARAALSKALGQPQ